MLKISSKFLLHIVTLFLILVCITACATKLPSYQAVGSLDSLCQLQNLHAEAVVGKKEMTEVHTQALQDIAMSVGAQAGLAWRSKEINKELSKHAKELDSIFNFNLMLLDHNVVPPVLVQGNHSLNLADSQTLRIDDRIYQIVSQARFTTAPPQWHDYLWMNYKAPQIPPAAFLPKTLEEHIIWKKYAVMGWQDGIGQANNIFGDSLSRLQRDYTGMALYRSLLVKGMVSKPFVAHTNLGVTGNSSHLHINDQIFRITSLPKLQTNPKRWKPVITHDTHTCLPTGQ